MIRKLHKEKLVMFVQNKQRRPQPKKKKFQMNQP
jgi:hypothetical protein